jgi:hypothetical protein
MTQFKPYPQDIRPTAGDESVLDRVKVFPNQEPALVDQDVNDFIDTLVALPNHTPIIVGMRFEQPTNNSASVLLHYRLIGSLPFPVL